MKISSGLSAPVTHNLIIADRSDDGRLAISTILEICPSVDGRIGAWHNSSDRFFVFIIDKRAGVLEPFRRKILSTFCSEFSRSYTLMS